MSQEKALSFNPEDDLTPSDFEKLLIQEAKEYFSTEEKLKGYAKEARRTLFGNTPDNGIFPGIPNAVEEIEAFNYNDIVLRWNPFKKMSKKAKCATCIAAHAVVAAAIVAAAVAILGSGAPVVICVGELCTKFSISQAAAWAAASGASAGTIATMLCPDCR